MKESHGNLNIEGITDFDFKHIKKVWRDLEFKNIDLFLETR